MRNILLIAAGLVLVATGAVGGYAATTNTKAKIVPLETMRWTPQAPDLPQTVVELWGDRTADGGYGELVRLPPGFDSRLHAHSGDFHGVLVAGTWLHIEEDGTGAIRRSNPAPTSCRRAAACISTAAPPMPSAFCFFSRTRRPT